MHKVFIPSDYDMEEVCPHCNAAVAVLIDQDDYEHYQVVCPSCGKEMMLCGLCRDDQMETEGNYHCDWTKEHGCFRQRK